MATLKTTLKLLSYTDTVSSNDPDEVLHDLEKEFLDEGITEVDQKLVRIPALATDQEINFEMTDIKYLFIQNRSTALHIRFKINGTGSDEQFIGPEGFDYKVSTDNDGTGQIQSLHVTNPDANATVTLRIFAAK